MIANSIPVETRVTLTPPETAFVTAQTALFRELRLEVRSRFLWSHDLDRRVHVLEAGAGQPMLMIHGGNSVAASWAPLLAELGDGYRVFAPDRPGCGLTHRQDYAGIAFRDHAITFVGDVMDGLGLDRATLVGNSMGGYWSLVFALAHPSRVERVILLGEPAGSSASPPVRFRVAATPYINQVLFSTVLRPRHDLRMFSGLMADPRRVSRTFIDCAYAGAMIPGARRAWRTMLERVVGPAKNVGLSHALVPELDALQLPVLFAWGDHDFAPVDAGHELSRHMPNARFELIPDAGHLIWLDQPALIARLVTDFMQIPTASAKAR